MNHDINGDPEVWAMRRQIGEKALSIWLEFLSIADRNDGELPGDLEELIRLVAGRCQATKRTVTAVYQFATSRLWLDYQPPLRVVKYAKYHRIEERNPRPPDPTEPIKNNKTVKKQSSASEFPADFALTASTIEVAGRLGITAPENLIEAFRDYHVSKGNKFKDWQAAFRTWLRNSKRFTVVGQPKRPKGQFVG